MRQGNVFYKDYFAGTITETDDGEYVFQYDSAYVSEHPELFLSFTMPVTDKPYSENRLFPFFEGLIPEGWLLEIASESWRINPNDRMGLLLACCQNCIGAVSVVPIEEDDDA
ncbi:HipA N-terminal domain-containing protein [Mangrovibacterium marinum]|uniref:Serine/threonine-protein kinase HipA n=1 Tax=Mangrovibacterium marinum TaxID=1639118 RepID=A0A2T5BV99_9BACT|nr:HipA N-terminal domain-containing protein [Mangrovibacterium marinum]PTN03465.1 serine/threonine-protein kinase HipA [Mangrovibacterium marinum]